VQLLQVGNRVGTKKGLRGELSLSP
jgi:hypothetical protein